MAAEEVGAAHGGARGSREDEPVILPEGTHPELLLVLAGAVEPEGFCGLERALYGPALAVLGLFEDVPALPGLTERTSHLQQRGGFAQVYVVPLQAQKLALSEAAMQSAST